MATKLFIGKLSFTTTEETLSKLFKEYGEIASLSIINDRDTGKSRGFAFVEMNDEEAAKKAVAELNNKEVDGRSIVVSIAEERERKSPSTAGYQRSW